MSSEIDATEWVNAKATTQRKTSSAKRVAGTGNGNIEGTFAEVTTLVNDSEKFEIPAGAYYHIFGPMDGSKGVAATIAVGNTVITIRRNGSAYQKAVESGKRTPRMSVPFGIG